MVVEMGKKPFGRSEPLNQPAPAFDLPCLDQISRHEIADKENIEPDVHPDVDQIDRREPLSPVFLP